MDLGIQGRKALVCGASSGLGLACARALVREGVDVVIRPPAESLQGMDPFVVNMHTVSGLLDELDGGMTLDEAQAQCLEYVRQYCPEPGKAPLAGNSVGTDRVFLDLTPQGALDNSKGKNRQQRVYREATGMNKPGEPFAWAMLQSKLVKVKLTHELYNGEIGERVSGILPS